MDKDEIISTLNDLIETCKDGEEGFRTCSENLIDPQVGTTFSNRATACNLAAQELQAIVAHLGGDPEDSASMSGAMHRRWVDFKSAVARDDDVAVLNECERGEDVAKKSYENALEKDLPPEIRDIVARQYNGVLRNHDQVKALRDQARAAKDVAG